VLVGFWALWCGPCRSFAPTFTAASEKHPAINFGKVDTEAEQGLAAAAGNRAVPTLMAFRDYVLVFSQPGALIAASLEELIAGVENLNMDDVRASIAARSDLRPHEHISPRVRQRHPLSVNEWKASTFPSSTNVRCTPRL
jgi:thioredoxin-like negative regulator of GroEL